MDGDFNASSLFMAAVLGLSIMSNSLELIIAALILVVIFYSKPRPPSEKRPFEREFTV